MSVDFEDESKKSEAVDGEPQDVPGLVRMSKHAVETSMSQHATLSADDAAKVPTESESEVAAEFHQQHHLTREQLAKAREQLEQQLNTETVVGGKSKLPLMLDSCLQLLVVLTCSRHRIQHRPTPARKAWAYPTHR